jgi:hypothetical protein
MGTFFARYWWALLLGLVLIAVLVARRRGSRDRE